VALGRVEAVVVNDPVRQRSADEFHRQRVAKIGAAARIETALLFGADLCDDIEDPTARAFGFVLIQVAEAICTAMNPVVDVPSADHRRRPDGS